MKTTIPPYKIDLFIMVGREHLVKKFTLKRNIFILRRVIRIDGGGFYSCFLK